MSDLKSLSTSCSASKFLPPADSSQHFFLRHYILLLFFLCLFLIRRLNISLLQIFSLFTSLFSSPPLTKCFVLKILSLFIFFVLLCFYWENTNCPSSISTRTIKKAKKCTVFSSFFLLCSPFLPPYISIMSHYTLFTTNPLKIHEVLDPIPAFIFAVTSPD